MEFRRKVRAIIGRGLECDRYTTEMGSKSYLPGGERRNVSLLSKERIDRVNYEIEENGLCPFRYGETRRNIITTGIEMEQFEGWEFSVGGVLMRYVCRARSCNSPSYPKDKPSFRHWFGDNAGIIAQIVDVRQMLPGAYGRDNNSGEIAIGNGIVLLRRRSIN